MVLLCRGWGEASLIKRDISSISGTATQIVIDKAGNALAAWLQWDGVLNNLWASRFTVGSGWSSAILIKNDNKGSVVDSPQIVIDDAENTIAMWEQRDETHINLWANRFTVGSGWGSAVLLETGNMGSVFDSQISINASGNAFAVWRQWDGTRSNLWANSYTIGSDWQGATLIKNDNTVSVGQPKIAIDDAGNALAMWRQWDGTRQNLWANRYTIGSGWDSTTPIENGNTGSVSQPKIAIDGASNALAVWTRSDGTRNNLWANRYTIGSGWGSATLIETDNAGGAYIPQIVTDDAGNVLAVWMQSDGARYNIWANHYTVGSGWGSATLIETDNTEDTTQPQIAIDRMGNVMVVWSQSDGTRDNIWANRYTIGSGWGIATMIETDNTGRAVSPQVAVDDVGNALTIWWQWNGGNWNIWANRFYNYTGN